MAETLGGLIDAASEANPEVGRQASEMLAALARVFAPSELQDAVLAHLRAQTPRALSDALAPLVAVAQSANPNHATG